MSVLNELLALIKPLIGMEEGQTVSKWMFKAGMKQAAKLTPNLSKTLLYSKKATRSDLTSALVKLLTGNDELGKQFRASFSEALKLVNLKTNLLIEEKSKIAVELGKQDKFKTDEIKKMSTEEANDAVDEMIEDAVPKVEKIVKQVEQPKLPVPKVQEPIPAPEPDEIIE